jgi:hypothetical protein
MNLVQINERLKDLPMQVVQQYANGMNPEVPPYLALGELQRRELSQKQMATAQGGMQGPQPSVKEQVEQKAGLMALQQMQQQQAMQQMAQPRGPMPAPAGVPQPEPQPEAMMARGGLASIPVRSDMFEYAGGGIIAFQEGGQPKKYETPYDRMNRENREKASEEPRVINLPKGTSPDEVELIRIQNPDAIVRTEDEGSRLRDIGQTIKRGLTYSSDVEAMKQRAAQPPVSRPTEQMTPQQMEARTAPAGLPSAARQMGVGPTTSASPAAPRPAPPMAPRPAPAAAQPGLPGAAAAMTPQDEVAKLSLDAVRTPAKAMTPEEAMAQEGKFASQYGIDKKFGEEERGLLALMKQRQADYAQRRPMEELGATLRGFGQGYGGASAAGERAGRETYEMDMSNQREMLNAINAINKENLATGKERYKSGSGLFGKSEESAAAANRQRMETLGSMSNKDKEVANAAENRLNNLEVEKLRIAERQAERNQPGSAAKVRAEYLNMMDQVFALEDKGEKAQADALRRRAEARLTAGGGTGTAGVGAERNDISRKRLQIQTWEKIRDSSSDPAAMKEAEGKILQLARDIAKIESSEDGGGKPITKAEYDKLPKGATYIAPDGTQRTKG